MLGHWQVLDMHHNTCLPASAAQWEQGIQDPYVACRHLQGLGPQETGACYTLLFPQLSPAKERFLVVHFLPVFILAEQESVATQLTLALCWGTCRIMSISGLQLLMVMLLKECLSIHLALSYKNVSDLCC